MKKKTRSIAEYESIFQDALGLLIKRHSFFGQIMTQLVRIPDHHIKLFSLHVMKTGKIALLYNLNSIKKEFEESNVTLKNLTAMIQHVIYHLISEHFLRKKSGNFNDWIITSDGPQSLFGICCDLAVNQYIDNLPRHVWKLNSFKGVTLSENQPVEDYYKILTKRIKEENDRFKQKFDGIEKNIGDAIGVLVMTSDNDDQNVVFEAMMEFMPFNEAEYKKEQEKKQEDDNFDVTEGSHLIDEHYWDEISEIPETLIDATVKQIVKEAYRTVEFGGYGCDNIPAGIERMCKETLKPVYNFAPYLRKFVDGEVLAKYSLTWKRPHRIKKYRNLYPGKKSEMQGKIGVVADTSGSMYDEDMAIIAKNLSFMCQYAQIILFEVDAAIHDVREYTRAGFDNILKGGGGTNFNDVLKVVKNYKVNKGLLDGIPLKRREKAFSLVRDIDALIFITDGQVYGMQKEKPRIPVLWALTDVCGSPPVKWGKVIYLDNKPEKHGR